MPPRSGHVRLPAELLFSLPGELLALYGRVKYHDRGEGCWAGLAALKGVLSEDQTRRNLRELQRRGLVTIEERSGRPNLIRCTPGTDATPRTSATPGTSATPCMDATPSAHATPCAEATPPLAPTPGAPGMDATPPLASMPPEVDPGSRSKNQIQESDPAPLPPKGGAAGGLQGALFVQPDPEQPAQKASKRRAKTTADAPPLELPDWLPPDRWEAFRAHRRGTRAPLTGEAERLSLATLEKLRAEGQDPVAVINRSIERGWRGLFPVDAQGQTGVGDKWRGQPNRPTAREDQEFTAAHLDRLLEESK